MKSFFFPCKKVCFLFAVIVERISEHVFVFSNTGAYRNVTPLKYRTNKSVITYVYKYVFFLRLYILNYFYIQWHIMVFCCDRKIGTINIILLQNISKSILHFHYTPSNFICGYILESLCCSVNFSHLTCHLSFSFQWKKNQTSVGKCFHIRGYMGKT